MTPLTMDTVKQSIAKAIAKRIMSSRLIFGIYLPDSCILAAKVRNNP
jgi:hypothetical protein